MPQDEGRRADRRRRDLRQDGPRRWRRSPPGRRRQRQHKRRTADTKPNRASAAPHFASRSSPRWSTNAPEGDDWIHETKFDGYRCLAALGKGGTRLFTRSGKDWTDRFAALDEAFDRLPCDSALIDGEVMARQVIRLGVLVAAARACRTAIRWCSYAFDLLSLDGDEI